MVESKRVATRNTISVKVLGVDNATIQYMVNKRMPLMGLMNDYCKRTGLNMATIRFRMNGRVVAESHTPASLGLKDGDVIEVYQYQIGG